MQNSTSPPTIRRATMDDLEQVISLRIEFLGDCWQCDCSSDTVLQISTREYVERNLPTHALRVWFAETGGEVVATGGMIFFDRMPTVSNKIGREAYLLSVYTRPAWRGRGIANVMMREMIDHAWAEGVGRIFLHASDAGRPIYEKLGFTTTGTDMELLPK